MKIHENPWIQPVVVLSHLTEIFLDQHVKMLIHVDPYLFYFHQVVYSNHFFVD